VALLSLLQSTARIKEPRAALVQARRTGSTSGCPVKIGEPVNQAAIGIRIWTGVDVDDTVLRAALDTLPRLMSPMGKALE
jgi:hypothetical protein